MPREWERFSDLCVRLRVSMCQWKALVGGDTHHPKTKETFHLNIAGATFDISYDDWYLTLSNQVRDPCARGRIRYKTR
jgi:hypothetical protein